MKTGSVRCLPMSLTSICSMDTVPFPKLKQSLLAQTLSLPVTEAVMSSLLGATTFCGGCFALTQLCVLSHGVHASFMQEAVDKCSGIVSSSLKLIHLGCKRTMNYFAVVGNQVRILLLLGSSRLSLFF